METDFAEKWQSLTFQCNGNRYNYSTENIAEPDLSGIGVTISFVTTAIGTFAIILYGFYRGLIVDNLKHPVDKAVFGWLGCKNPPSGSKRDREKKALHAAIWALSDQHLVIGLATLVAGLSNCELSFYGLRNLVEVAWLTAIVHLSTLVVTGQEIHYNTVTRFIRAGMMLLMLLLLVLTTAFYLFTDSMVDFLRIHLILSASKQNRGVITKQVENAFAVRFFLAHGMSLAKSYSRDRNKTVYQQAVEAYVSLFVIYFYASRLLPLLGFTSNRNQFFRERLFRHRASRFSIELPQDFSYAAYRNARENLRWDRTAQNRAKLVRPVRDTVDGVGSQVRGSYLSKRLYHPARVFLHYMKKLWYPILLYWVWLPTSAAPGFIWEILWLNFILVQALARFGICWIGFKRLSNAETERDIMTWGLGQIIAIFLLLIPVMSWLQVMFEKNRSSIVDQSASHTQVSSTSVLPVHEALGTVNDEGFMLGISIHMPTVDCTKLLSFENPSMPNYSGESSTLTAFYSSRAFLWSNLPWIYSQLLGAVVLALGQTFNALKTDYAINFFPAFLLISFSMILIKLIFSIAKFLINILVAATDDMAVIRQASGAESRMF
ncbi:hypothetical protein BJ508DRAFT_381043 [Ascobolus immersus RN42]|uniref:Uncharacterized protein n=1 Tax=Ascobolus immersus RN42 TaxID=1160509 RepID=A0A3N4HJL0_ASCIM|nr:hypothetical protein BJ508DRAFT_381043 [Ascobolus immersus RN42]